LLRRIFAISLRFDPLRCVSGAAVLVVLVAERRGRAAGPRARDGTRPTWLAARAAVSWARRGTIGTQQPTTQRPT